MRWNAGAKIPYETMRRIRRVAICCRDTLRAGGLRNLLVSYFPPMEIDLYATPDEWVRYGDYDMYFVEEEAMDSFAGMAARKLVRLTLGDGQGEKGEHQLDTSADLHSMVEAIKGFFGRHEGESEENKSLTPREIQVLRLVVSGAINKEIAQRLSISFNTVLTHRKNISAKTGIKTVSGLTFYALLNGYVSPAEIGMQ